MNTAHASLQSFLTSVSSTLNELGLDLVRAHMMLDPERTDGSEASFYGAVRLEARNRERRPIDNEMLACAFQPLGFYEAYAIEAVRGPVTSERFDITACLTGRPATTPSITRSR